MLATLKTPRLTANNIKTCLWYSFGVWFIDHIPVLNGLVTSYFLSVGIGFNAGYSYIKNRFGFCFCVMLKCGLLLVLWTKVFGY